VDLGHQLMRDAEAGVDASVRKNAAVFRMGFQMALLAMRPLRMRNFSGIRIGVNLVREGDVWWLRFARAETKTRQPIEVPFPKELYPALERYLAHFRPLLAGPGFKSDLLWVSYHYKPLSPHTLQLSLTRITEKAFGKPINPHLFRDCVATSIAINDPAAVRMAATILGHRSFATTEKYYNLASSLQAGRALADSLASRRTSSNKNARRGASRKKKP
jgi:integrase